MKLKTAVLKSHLNIAGFSGVRSLGSGQGRGITSPGPKETLEYKDRCVFVSKDNKLVLIVPCEQVEYMIPAED